MLDQAAWVDVVTQPMGIAAFALFLVFLVLSRSSKSEERSWLMPTFISLAVISLLGGLALSFIKVHQEPVPNGNQSNGNNPTIIIHADTNGDYSPVIGTIGGDANIGNITPDTEQNNDE